MTKLVRDVMKIGVPTCQRDTTLDQVACIMARDNMDAVVVMDEFGACGVISQTDLVRAFTRNYQLIRAEEVMNEQIVGISPDTTLTGAANMMEYENVHQLFIMHDHPGPSRPSAMINMRQIVRVMAGLEPERAAAKPPLVKVK